MNKDDGMTCEEFLEFVEKKKSEGWTINDIMNLLFRLFANNEITVKELRKLANALGYDLSKEFIAELEKENISYK